MTTDAYFQQLHFYHKKIKTYAPLIYIFSGYYHWRSNYMRFNIISGAILGCSLLFGCSSISQPFQKTTLEKKEANFPFAPGSTGVIVRGISGPVGWVGDTFAEAMAESLRRRGVIAGSEWSNRYSLSLTANGYQQLYINKPSELVVSWMLADSNNDVRGIIETRSIPPESFWNAPSSQMFKDIAETNADQVVNWINPRPVINKKNSILTITVEKTKEAPGDGVTSLALAMRAALSTQNINPNKTGTSDLNLKLAIEIFAVGLTNHKIRLNWVLETQDKQQIGIVSQENILKTKVLYGAWGTLADDIAAGALEGLMLLINEYQSTLPVDVKHRMQ
jgi:hypothetical protein